MNRINFLVTLAITFSVAAFGCDAGSVGARQEMPASTMPVIDRVEECGDNRLRNLDNNDLLHAGCLDNPNREYEECNEEYEANQEQTREVWETCLTNLPMVPASCVAQLEPFSFEHDTDGDGIPDYWEYHMGLNPCEKCSYGGVEGVDCDADLDYDRDGTANGIDYNPMCGHFWETNEWQDLPDGAMSDGYCI